MSAVPKPTREGVGNHAPSDAPACSGCGQPFTPKRTNQRYCTPPCQKAATRNTARGPRTTAESPSRRHEKRLQWATLAFLNETLYGHPVGQRLGLLRDWLDRARAGDTTLRAALTRPDFCKWTDNSRACFRSSLAYPPVPYLTHKYCQKLLGCTVADWVHGRASEPETGEVIDAATLAA